jgi:uncharacterized SAM-binding protein YcdF (DUF218 family)
MFFILSKLFWLVFAPGNLLLWPPLATAVLLWFRRIRLARRAAIASVALIVVIGVVPLGTIALRPLENRFPRPAWPAQVDGILVLGGGLDAATFASRGVVGHPNAEPRLVAAFELARRHPNARVIFSGGSGEILGGDGESPVAKYIFAQLGLAPARLVLEDQSRNTWENIVFSQRIAKPRKGQVWVLATSASHLPRAMGVAARLKWEMVPWPTDYVTRRSGGGNWFDLPGNAMLADMALHEWLGLAVYRLSHKTAPVR